jgi:hypothetical protein
VAAAAFVVSLFALAISAVSAYPAWRLWRIDRAKKSGELIMPTALDNGQRSTPKELAALVKRLLASLRR